MWNSNSVVSWLLARSDLRPERIQAPAGGRAPGWEAGIRVAALSDPKECIRAASLQAKSAVPG
jgi:hypothetical protein